MIKRCLTILTASVACPDILLGQALMTDSERIRLLEEQLLQARNSLEQLQTTVDGLVIDLAAICGRDGAQIPLPVSEGLNESLPSETPPDTPESYPNRLLVRDLGEDVRDEELALRPELFVQSRYHAKPIDEARDDDVTNNFALSRMETRWAGRVSEHVGIGFELQYHPAPDGAAEELVNDAFVEYYAGEAMTVRVGQFVKPFGFDIQHSSSDRESPERGIFAGYFFPGQRDRGAMVTAELGQAADWLGGVSVNAGMFNGNRFFNDYDDGLNYNFRIRKIFDSLPLAIGASAQIGRQLAAPSFGGSADENLFGFDVQYVARRLGIRAEYVRGDMPATLLSLEPEFSPAFAPGETSTGAALFFRYNLTPRDDIYWRWDRLENDPVTGNDIRAFNVGYLRSIGLNSGIGIDYQTKNDVTFNDDELNTRLSITWNVEY